MRDQERSRKTIGQGQVKTTGSKKEEEERRERDQGRQIEIKRIRGQRETDGRVNLAQAMLGSALAWLRLS